jgi:hypothetical protein
LRATIVASNAERSRVVGRPFGSADEPVEDMLRP